MPILPISDGAGHLLPDAWQRLWAVVLWPNSIEGQKRFLEHEALLDFQGDKNRVEWLNGKRLDGARNAGLILFFLLCAHKFAPQHASVEKMIWLLGDVKVHKILGIENESRRALYNHWKEFGAVAHIMAALDCAIMMDHSQITFGRNVKIIYSEQLEDSSDILVVLALSEIALASGQKVRAARAKTNVMAGVSSWTVPKDIQLPTPTFCLFDFFTPPVLKIIQGYRANLANPRA